jgi:hypothetical protein
MIMHFLHKIKKFLVFIKFFFSIGVKHQYSTISINNKSIISNNIGIINLENIEDWQLNEKESLLISYTGDSHFNENNDYPAIESWLNINNRTLAPNNFHLFEQFKKINSNFKKKQKIIEEPTFVLPYYTSVFGHFSGDIFGSVLYYLKYLIKNHKLLLYTPSKEWTDFFNKNFKDKVLLIKPKDALQNNYLLKRSLIIPRMNTLQNYMLSNNIINEYLDKKLSSHDKIFLTSGRNSRISNVDEVCNFLEKRNFKIVHPQKMPIIDLLSIIKYSKCLISEKASTLNNIHLCRNNKYYILSSSTEKIDDNKKFSYAGIYKSFHKGMYEEIFCNDDPNIQLLSPYKKRIFVDLKKLENF